MRRRKPHTVTLTDKDRTKLKELLSNGRTEQRIARRARVLLEMEDPETIVEELAVHIGQTPMTVWRICRHYEQRGIDAIYDTIRSGRPREISPSGASRN